MSEVNSIDAFAEEFLAALQPALAEPTPSETLRFVRQVCEDFQARAHGDVRLGIIPLSFWMNLTADFVDVYVSTEDTAKILLRLRAALRARMREYARRHDVPLDI